MTTPPTSRGDLIRQIASRVTHPACGRAFTSGTVEVLGRFARLPPAGSPGWVVRVTTRHGRSWLLGWSFSTESMRFELAGLPQAPWPGWLGSVDGKNPLHDGDRPAVYAREKSNV